MKVKRDNGVNGENGGVMLFAAMYTLCQTYFSRVDYVPITFANYVTEKTILFAAKYRRNTCNSNE